MSAIFQAFVKQGNVRSLLSSGQLLALRELCLLAQAGTNHAQSITIDPAASCSSGWSNTSDRLIPGFDASRGNPSQTDQLLLDNRQHQSPFALPALIRGERQSLTASSFQSLPLRFRTNLRTDLRFSPSLQSRYMSAQARHPLLYPEIEEAPSLSMAAPLPLPQSKHMRQEDWPPADYLREARAAIFQKQAFIIDMDGVVYRGSNLLPGVREFVQWLLEEDKRFLFLTNSSDKTREELQQKLARMGVDVETEHFYTAALATAAFLTSQRPNGSAYVIGDPGVLSALYSVGYSMNDVNPDYVVVGETRNYNYERLEHAVHLVLNGSKLIGTNCDKTDPSPDHPGEVIPAAGSIIKPIESATGLQAYFVGKPNPLMMRSALATLGASRESTIIIGDRMDTDILGGLEASIDSALVLSGVTSLAEMRRFAYMPRFVLRGLVDLVPEGVQMSAVARS